MMRMQRLPWMEPLDVARGLQQEHWVLLYSGAAPGSCSYLACDIEEKLESSDFDALEARLQHGSSAAEGAWFGTLGYGLRRKLEALAAGTPCRFGLDGLVMMRFARIYRFDHAGGYVECWHQGDAPPPPPHMVTAQDYTPPTVQALGSNMSREAYLQKVARVLGHIAGGDLYQANLTRKFHGQFASPPDGLALFTRLCAVSPAAYSAYVKLGAREIISSSPELFLKADANGLVCVQPIKGTLSRTGGNDAAERAQLLHSEKDRAENLMITDLMRNDLARCCAAGSVRVRSLFDITTHATLHHLSSTVEGRLAEGKTVLDAVKACFPPGSMTGAPKIRAMQLCAELEKDSRGLYSGAIGWFGGDGSVMLSVVIRTLVLQGTDFEFQVGGGIVADSTPQRELEELVHKARGLCLALGISARQLLDL
jgi:para-aminobenzoate synthetase component 1